MSEMKLLQNMWRKKRSVEKPVTKNAPEVSISAQAPACTSIESCTQSLSPPLSATTEQNSEKYQAPAPTVSSSENKNPLLARRAENVGAPLHVTNPFLLRKERQRDEGTRSKNEDEREEVCREDQPTSEGSAFYMQKNSASNRAIYQFETGSYGDENKERDVEPNKEASQCQDLKNGQSKPITPPAAMQKQSLGTRAKYQFEADSDDEDDEIEVEITGELLEEIEARKKRVYENLRKLKIIGEARGSEISSHVGCPCTMNSNIDDQIVMNRSRLDRIR